MRLPPIPLSPPRGERKSSVTPASAREPVLTPLAAAALSTQPSPLSLTVASKQLTRTITAGDRPAVVVEASLISPEVAGEGGNAVEESNLSLKNSNNNNNNKILTTKQPNSASISSARSPARGVVRSKPKLSLSAQMLLAGRSNPGSPYYPTKYLSPRSAKRAAAHGGFSTGTATLASNAGKPPLGATGKTGTGNINDWTALEAKLPSAAFLNHGRVTPDVPAETGDAPIDALVALAHTAGATPESLLPPALAPNVPVPPSSTIKAPGNALEPIQDHTMDVGRAAKAARSSLRAGRAPAAVSAASKALATGTVSVDLLLLRGTALLESGKPQQAWADFNLAVQMDPLCGPCYQGRAAAALASGDADAAARDYLKTIAVQGPSPLLLLDTAKALTLVGATQDAEAYFGAAIDADPENADAYAARAGVYTELGHSELAAKDIRTALSLSPLHALPAAERACEEESVNNWAGAASSLRTVLRFHPQSTEAQLRLARAVYMSNEASSLSSLQEAHSLVNSLDCESGQILEDKALPSALFNALRAGPKLPSLCDWAGMIMSLGDQMNPISRIAAATSWERAARGHAPEQCVEALMARAQAYLAIRPCTMNHASSALSDLKTARNISLNPPTRASSLDDQDESTMAPSQRQSPALSSSSSPAPPTVAISLQEPTADDDNETTVVNQEPELLWTEQEGAKASQEKRDDYVARRLKRVLTQIAALTLEAMAAMPPGSQSDADVQAVVSEADDVDLVHGSRALRALIATTFWKTTRTEIIDAVTTRITPSLKSLAATAAVAAVLGRSTDLKSTVEAIQASTAAASSNLASVAEGGSGGVGGIAEEQSPDFGFGEWLKSLAEARPSNLHARMPDAASSSGMLQGPSRGADARRRSTRGAGRKR